MGGGGSPSANHGVLQFQFRLAFNEVHIFVQQKAWTV